MNYYHGTSFENAIKILKSQKIECNYFDGKGCFLADNLEHSFNFGSVIFKFDSFDFINKLSQDGVDDGYYFNGVLDLKYIPYSVLILNSRQTLDFFNSTLKGDFLNELKKIKIGNVLFEIAINANTKYTLVSRCLDKTTFKRLNYLIKNFSHLSLKELKYLETFIK